MDYLSLKAAVSEASHKLSGSKITDVWQAGPHEIVLLAQRDVGLLLSIDPGRPGLYMVAPGEMPDRTPSPFTDLLRTRIKGNTIVSTRLLEPGERIITITFLASWPAKEGTPLEIVFEVMGRRSNLMLVEEGRILQPLRSVSRQNSPARPVLAGTPYRPPPGQTGNPVEDATAKDLPSPVSVDETRRLQETVRGLSPYTAYQALRMSQLRPLEGNTGDDRKELAAVLSKMIDSCTGETGFLLTSRGKMHLSPFEPIPYDGSDALERYNPFSAAALVWKLYDPSGTVEVHDEAAFLKKSLQERLMRIRSALEHVDAEEERCKAHDEIRVMAQALLISAAEIPHGAESATLPDPYDPGLELTIPLDRSQSPQENANKLFNRARRLERGLEETSTRRNDLSMDMNETRQAMEALDDRNDTGPARTLLEMSTTDIPIKGKMSQPVYNGPGRRHKMDGFTILVGKSSTDNERVTFKAAGPSDLWLHARDYPGSHVVILTEKRQVPDKVLYAAAALAAKGSGAKNDNAPEIMVTERKWVRKLKGGKPGQVTVERFKTIRPRTDSPKSKTQRQKGKG